MGEAIGLFANESQIAAFAAKELGLDWKNATEAQKQLTRQDFAIAMQAAAGATGQASRESENLTNVQGNLTTAWQTLLAKLGTPILPMVTDWIIALTDKVQSFNADKLIADFKAFYEQGKSAVKMVIDFVDRFSPLIAGVLAGAVAYKAITAGIVAYNAVLKAYRAVALLATTGQIGLNLAMLANPVGIVVVAIGALIAIGVALYKNQDKIIAKTTQLWSTIKQKFNDIKTAVTASVTAVKTVITNKWNEVMSFFRAIDLREIGINIIAGLIGGITSKATELYSKARDIANSVKNTFKNLFDINSPSRFMEKFIGVNMMDGWIKGIVGMKSAILRATTSMSEWMTPQTPTLSVAGYKTPTSTSGMRQSLQVSTLDQDNPKGITVNQTNTFTSQNYTPSEIARKNKQTMQQLAMEWR